MRKESTNAESLEVSHPDGIPADADSVAWSLPQPAVLHFSLRLAV